MGWHVRLDGEPPNRILNGEDKFQVGFKVSFFGSYMGTQI